MYPPVFVGNPKKGGFWLGNKKEENSSPKYVFMKIEFMCPWVSKENQNKPVTASLL